MPKTARSDRSREAGLNAGSSQSISSRPGESEAQRELFSRALRASHLFASIEDEFCQDLFQATVEIVVPQGETIFWQGQTGALMFVIVEGSVQTKVRSKLTNKPKAAKIHGPSDILCETAVLEALVHRETAEVVSASATLLALHRIEYQLAALRFAEKRAATDSHAHDFVASIYLFQHLASDQRALVLSQVRWEAASPHQVLVPENTPEPGLIIIESGEALVQVEYSRRDAETLKMTRSTEVIRCLHRGELFGEAAAISEALRSSAVGYQVLAGPQGAKIGIVPHTAISQALGAPSSSLPKAPSSPQETTLQATHIAHTLSHHPLFSELTRVEIVSMSQLVTTARIGAGHIAGSSDGLWLVLDGALTVFRRSEPFVSLTAGDCYGDASGLVGEQQLRTRSFGSRFFPGSPAVVARATGEAVCALISRALLVKLGLEYRPALARAARASSTSSSALSVSSEPALSPAVPTAAERASFSRAETSPIPPSSGPPAADGKELVEATAALKVQEASKAQGPPARPALARLRREDLTLVRRLFTGPASKLYYARYEPTNQILAVKEVSDLSSIGSQSTSRRSEGAADLGHSAHVEIALMLQLASTNTVPRILGMMAEPERALITVSMEPMIGGDLAALIEKRPGSLELAGFTFYAACLVHALKVLFENNVLHRDIKPANVMIDRSGYLRLIDFGISKGNICGETARTSTLCGTPKYMAPEVARLVLGRGISYGLAVDWWALGVTLFELACGFNPFEFVSAPSLGTDAETSAQGDADTSAPSVHIMLHRVVAFAEALTTSSSEEDGSTQKGREGSLQYENLQSLPGGFGHLANLDPAWDAGVDFILRLLHPSGYQRLGMGLAGPRGAMEHRLFDGFPWRELGNRTLTPPFVPEEPAFFRKAKTAEPGGGRGAARRQMLMQHRKRRENKASLDPPELPPNAPPGSPGEAPTETTASDENSTAARNIDDDDEEVEEEEVESKVCIENRLMRSKAVEVVSNSDIARHSKDSKRQSLGLLAATPARRDLDENLGRDTDGSQGGR